MGPLQWMGAVRMRVQTADKNITIIHTTPVQQWMYYEAKMCVSVRNTSIINFSHFWPKCWYFPVHNPLYRFLQWKPPSTVILSHQRMLKDCLELLCTVFTCKRCLICAYFFSWFRLDYFFTIESYIIEIRGQFEVKNALMMDSFLTNTQLLAS